MTKRSGRVDPRPWLVVLNEEGRAESMWDAGQPGLNVLPGARYWHERDANAHRDTFNRELEARQEREELVRRGQGDLFA